MDAVEQAAFEDTAAIRGKKTGTNVIASRDLARVIQRRVEEIHVVDESGARRTIPTPYDLAEWQDRGEAVIPLELVELGERIRGFPVPWRVIRAEHGFDCASKPAYEASKRGMDLLLSFLGLIIILPIMAAVWVLMKLFDPGPLFYAHDRVGRGGICFRCYKIRTMISGADRQKDRLRNENQHADHRTFKMPGDPRVTALGRHLRRLSIDELPQLYNVLRGDMSLVGPRPALPSEVQFYADRDLIRLQVKPGLTCIWQVSGRSEIAFPEQVNLDLAYIASRSLKTDCGLILRTIPALVSQRGAY